MCAVCHVVCCGELCLCKYLTAYPLLSNLQFPHITLIDFSSRLLGGVGAGDNWQGGREWCAKTMALAISDRERRKRKRKKKNKCALSELSLF